MLTWLTRLILIVMVVSLGMGLYSYWQATTASEAPLIVDPVEFTRNDSQVGTQTIVLHITNPSDTPRRILGLEEG